MRYTLLLLLATLVCSTLKAQKIVHVYVALCDNDSQGIVPVPKKIGNGNDPDNNLYWGCGYGVRTFFKNSDDWQLMRKSKDPRTGILERLVFKHRRYDTYLVADGWRGSKIKDCTIGFFNSAAGQANDTVNIVVSGQIKVLNMQSASLICYVGHDGLMDFQLDEYPEKKGTDKKDVIILACASKMYFKEGIKAVGADPLLWTTNLMCPEAYSLKAAIDGWLLNETGQQLRERAAQEYNKYQKCGIAGARNLFATGF
jgi:hypothetical protein